MTSFGFPWEEDAKRAKRSKKAAKRIVSYRNMKRNGRKKGRVIHKDPDWYPEYLKSEHWQDFKRRYAESKLPQKCVVCGSDKYELHHRTYERVWHEHLTDVVPLCRAHHLQTHALVKQGHDLLHAHKYLIL